MKEDEKLAGYLLEELPKISPSFDDTPEVEGLTVTTSPDRKLRFWMWDSYTGGTMPDITWIAEYSTPSGIRAEQFTVDGHMNSGVIDSIWQVNTSDGRRFYLARDNWIGDSRTSGQSVFCFEIKGRKLLVKNCFQDYIVFEGHENAWTYDVTFGRDLFRDPEAAQYERIQFRSDGSLIVPVIDSVITYRRYYFDGQHYLLDSAKVK